MVHLAEEERALKAARLKSADALTGETRTAHRGKGRDLCRAQPLSGQRTQFRVLGNGAEFIWFSERGRLGHLIFTDGRTGHSKTRSPRGPWGRPGHHASDERNRWIYFTGGSRGKRP